ncbi:MAG: c-type cytochrome [Rhodospirillales bacterium]|nr:c-type cytochrome [Rhodospirillales bacterium]
MRSARLGLALLVAATTAQAADPATLGLPALAAPAAAPALVELGRKLFFDRRLSANGTMSCGMCHVPEQGFASNELRTPLGVEGRSLRRNAPTLLNVAIYTSLFLDGRAASLEAQAWDPLLAGNEMANPSAEAVATRVASLPDYRAPFAAAFPGAAPDRATIGAAIAAYERSLVAGGSRFDRWWFGGEAGATTAEEREGFALFRFRAGCAQCHSIGERDAAFTDQRFHNIGTGRARVAAHAAPVRVELVPGLATNVSQAALASFGEAPATDDGRMEVTGDTADRWKYRTPSLRNVALTGPYMHDGSLATLEAVVEFYDRGGGDDPGKAEWLFPLGLTPAEKASLVAFLKTLTGPNVEALARDARR